MATGIHRNISGEAKLKIWSFGGGAFEIMADSRLMGQADLDRAAGKKGALAAWDESKGEDLHINKRFNRVMPASLYYTNRQFGRKCETSN